MPADEVSVSTDYLYWDNVETATVTDVAGTDTENVIVKRLASQEAEVESGLLQGVRDKCEFLIPYALFAGPLVPDTVVTIGSETWKCNGSASIKRVGSSISHFRAPFVKTS